MRKRGFTLIELLAVIVILAIIAVITVPKIADMISSSRQGGAEDSFYGTLKAAELGYTKALQSNTDLKGSTCNIENSKITCTNGVEINVSGKTPESGVIAVSSNGVSGANIKLNGYKCSGDLSVNNPCTKITEEYAADQLKKELTATGDGLYNDSYEPTRFIYRGKNLNNYLTFDNAIWRIVAIENDNTIKIKRNENVTKQLSFDNVNARTTANNSYCKNPVQGCNAWASVSGIYNNGSASGTVIENASLNNYLNQTYYQTIGSDKQYIDKHLFNVGPVWREDSISILQNTEKQITWNGNIGILNVSDVMKAALNDSCQTILSSREASYPCSNYIFTSNSQWLLNGIKSSDYRVAWIDPVAIRDGNASSGTGTVRDGVIYPAVYLKANIKLDGKGTQIDPYKIKPID